MKGAAAVEGRWNERQAVPEARRIAPLGRSLIGARYGPIPVHGYRSVIADETRPRGAIIPASIVTVDSGTIADNLTRRLQRRR